MCFFGAAAECVVLLVNYIAPPLVFKAPVLEVVQPPVELPVESVTIQDAADESIAKPSENESTKARGGDAIAMGIVVVVHILFVIALVGAIVQTFS